MAKIKLDLTQFKASGVYTLEFDASESIILNTQTVRLVVGFSRKGPFNSPVYLPDTKTARRIFGEIDPFLESRGSFFHRSLFTCLEIGPIFGLNLLPLNNQPITQGGDAVEYKSYSVDTAESNGVTTKALYSGFYNTQRFWYPDETNLVAIANSNAINTGKLFHVVNLSQSPVSVIIRKTRVNGFDITARDWYGQSGEDMPAYVEDFDYIADYFVEVIIVGGKWTDYKKLSTDPVYSKFFNDKGILKGQLNAFLSSEEINTVARFTGCLLPDFVDGNGVNHSLDIVVNNSVATTGVFVAFNKEALADYETSTSKYDVIGHNLAKAAFDGNPSTNLSYLDMLSYKTNVKEEFEYEEEYAGTIISTEVPHTFELQLNDALTAGTRYWGLSTSADGTDLTGGSYVAELVFLRNSRIPGRRVFKLIATYTADGSGADITADDNVLIGDVFNGSSSVLTITDAGGPSVDPTDEIASITELPTYVFSDNSISTTKTYEFDYQEIYTDSYKSKGSFGAFKNILVINKPLETDVAKYNNYTFIKNNLVVQGSLILLESGKWGKVESKNETLDSVGNTILKITYSHPDKDQELTMTPKTILGGSFTTTESVVLTTSPSSSTFTLASGNQAVTTGSTTGLVAGMYVTGTGIPSGARIQSITSPTAFRLNVEATATGANSLSFSNKTFFSTTPGQLRINQPVSGTGIAAEAYITEISPTINISCTTTSGNTSVTATSTANLIAGMYVTGTGIESGTKIASITNGTTFVLSQEATATGTNTLKFTGMVTISSAITASGTVTLTYESSVVLSGNEFEVVVDGAVGNPDADFAIGTTYWGMSAPGNGTNLATGAAVIKMTYVGKSANEDKRVFNITGRFTATGTGAGLTSDSTITIEDVFDGDAVITTNTSSAPTLALNHQVSVKGSANYTILNGDELLIKNKIDTTTFYVNVNASPFLNADGNTIIPVDNILSLQDLSLNPSYYTATYGAVEYPRIVNQIATSEYVTFAFTPAIFFFDDNDADTVNKFIAYPYSQIYKDFESGFLADGDKYYYTADDYFFLKYTKTTDEDGIPIIQIRAYEDAAFNTVVTDTSTNTFEDTTNYQKGGSLNTGGIINIYPYADSFSDTYVVQSWNSTKSEIDVNVADATGLDVGQYLVSYTTDENGEDVWRLTKIIKKRKIFDEATSIFRFRYTVNQPIYIENEFGAGDKTVTRYKAIDDFATTYDFTALSGFKLNSFHLPGDRTNKQSQMEKIYEVLKTTNLFEALKSRDVIQFRYIVDTFDGGLQPNAYPKSILAELAKERLKSLALLNPPSAKQFEASTDPRFTDEPDPAGGNPRPLLNTAYIASGGNQTLGPSFSFTLPDEQNGAKHAAFFFPYIILRDGTKNITIPPAAHVSNNFVLKFINGFPYSIVAGPRRGVLSDSRLVGPEIDLSDLDRELLEPFGLNPIVKRQRIGTMIYGNQTAYQKVPSALNNVHVRDLLITIEEGVEDILSRYIFELNDATTRLEIKSIVDTFLDGVRSAGGIYNFFTQMDDTNNPPEIIDQNKAIIDIAVEPARGIQIAISRITVTKTGGANASAFQFV